MVDGEIWLPYYECNIGSDPCGKLEVRIYPSNNTDSFPLQINLVTIAELNSGSSSSFIISWHPDYNNGIWTEGEKLDSLYFEFSKGGRGSIYRRYPDTRPGDCYFRVTKLDAEKRIFSAVFDIWLYSRNNDKRDSVHLSNGRLDTKFRVCECD
jgi:hypothetical protein